MINTIKSKIIYISAGNVVPKIWIILVFLCFSIRSVSYAEDSQIRIAVIPDKPRPGDPITIGIKAAEHAHLKAVLLSGQGQRLTQASFFDLTLDTEQKETVKVAVMAIPCTARPGTALLQVQNTAGTIGEIQFTIESRNFIFEEIPLDQKNTDIRTVPDPLKTAESNVLWSIISRTGTEVYASGPFSPPVQSNRRTSFFGDRRVFIYVDGSRDASIHAGIDYGVPTGTEVRACAPGKVVLACSRIVTGNSVIIEHLPGVYSLYYHLDTIEVGEGVMVDTGDMLGQSGATGLATGPHLHWEIRVAGENTDPDAFMSRTILDKEVILSIFNSF